MFIPFSIKYGRRPVYLVTTFVLFICGIWQAVLRDYPNMVAVNVMDGLAGAVADTIVQMTVSVLSISRSVYSCSFSDKGSVLPASERQDECSVSGIYEHWGTETLLEFGNDQRRLIEAGLSCTCCRGIQCCLSRLAVDLLVVCYIPRH